MGKKEIDIFKHELVPEHRIMSEEEVKELLEKYGTTKKALPKILDTDPAVKMLGAKVGDVIEITRKSPVAKSAKYYRVVVKKKE